MFYLIEILIAAIITYFFIKKEKPKLKFLFLGYAFFFISLLLQLPFRYLETIFSTMLETVLFSTLTIIIITTIVSELTKYFSLKRFLTTKKYKNAILFGIGWSSLESINFFTSSFYRLIFSYVPIEFDYSSIISADLSFFNFIFLFVVNLAITIFVIFSIIKKKKKFSLVMQFYIHYWFIWVFNYSQESRRLYS